MTIDIEQNSYNTAIAAAMTMVNELYKLKVKEFNKNDFWQAAFESIVACVAPFAPHIAEELWQQLGKDTSVSISSWPNFDEKFLVEDSMTIVVQVNGKLRGEITLPLGSNESEIISAAKNNIKVASYLVGHSVKKSIYVPGKLINFVV